MGSIAGKEVYEHGNIYCASKFAVDAISKSMRIDLLKYGIKVTSIKQPQSSCPFKDAKQKVFGLGYNLLVFVYDN